MNSRALHLFAVFTAISTLALVAVGGLVTSHGVGLAVPDWPNTYGYNMFFFPISKWVGGIFYEHSHRLVASVVGLLTSVLALWLYGRKARRLLRWVGGVLALGGALTCIAVPHKLGDGVVLMAAGTAALLSSLFWPRSEAAPRWLRRLGLLAFGAVVLQGVLGGLRVVLLKDEIGIFHAALAQIFFALSCMIALFTSRRWQENACVDGLSDELPAGSRSLRWWFMCGTVMIFAQLVLGATMRHQHAGLAIPDFPLAYGRLWPATDANSVASYNRQRIEVTEANAITASQIKLQMAHRLLAGCILVVVLAGAWTARRLDTGGPVSKLAMLWAALISFQAALGAATIWSNKAADIATAHVIVGALSLALGTVLVALPNRSRVAVRSPVHSTRPRATAPTIILPCPEPTGKSN